jgi:D-ala D-ala ligase C-terminus
MFRIYPYKVGSASVKKLKEAIDAKIIKLEGSRYRLRDGHVVINWGNSKTPTWFNGEDNLLNLPGAVAIATDKLKTFQALEEDGVSHVEYTTDKEVAEEWLADGDKVFVRHSLTGHSGEGIEVVEPDGRMANNQLINIAGQLNELGYHAIEEQVIEAARLEDTQYLDDAPLYTRGVENKGEYRVHVFSGTVILYQKKSRRVDEEGNVVTPDGEEADVRNLATNWIYRTGNLKKLERVEELAIDAISALGLDFGAVDIIMDGEGEVYVLEINSAPGLGNTETLEAYKNAFNSIV